MNISGTIRPYIIEIKVINLRNVVELAFLCRAPPPPPHMLCIWNVGY